MPKTSADKPVTRKWVEGRFEKQEMLIEQNEQRRTEELKQFIRDTVKEAISESEERTKNHFETAIAESEERTKHHFDVVAENIHQDVAGANKDKVSLLENKSTEHEQRITAPEQTAGLR